MGLQVNTQTRRDFLKFTGLAAVAGVSLFNRWSRALAATKRPNMVWIMAEDLAKHHLRLYDDGGAPSPALEAMAKDGVIFDRAFCNGPVCSVARTSLITGCFATRIGTQYHRRIEMVPMPDGLKMFPAYLRQAGYYTTNSKKRDYNAEQDKDVWDQPGSARDAWKQRPTKETPFFHVSTYTQCHESCLHFPKKDVGTKPTQADPDKMKILPVHPDTELFRYTYARHQDRIMDVDTELAKTLADLEQEGVLDDTFVFYFGDNGGTLPGSKGYLYETGLHVPMVMHVPKNFKHLSPTATGHISGFVSFIDFGPTMLNLAGVKVPSQVDGKPFMGPRVSLDELNQRDETFSYACRFDELYYTSRSLRKGDFKYIRNYEPFFSGALQNNYRYAMPAFEQWRQLYKEGKLNPAQAKFFEPWGPEELYDLAADPYETKNLAGKPEYAQTLKKLRDRLREVTADQPDLGIIPECVWIEENGAKDPIAYGQRNKNRIAGYIETADLMMQPYKKAAGKLKAALTSDDPLMRFWALTVCAGFGKRAKEMAATAKALSQDDDNLVKCRAALFLALLKEVDPAPVFRKALKNAKDSVETLYILNDLVFLRDSEGCRFDFTKADVPYNEGHVKWRLEYLKWK